MNIINAPQGSQQWLDIRAKHFTASEAPAMMGASKYQTRTELLRQKHTGLAAEVDAGTQRLFDRGHAAEASARPIVEFIIGAELFPATGTLEVDGLPLLASFDGVTMLEDIVWESKLLNNGLSDQVRAGELEPHYYWQLEQQLLVSGAEKAYFTTSDGTAEGTTGMWYESRPERRAALISGWKQFADDLANYQHVEREQAPVAATIEALPALLVQVEGRVLATNLDAFKEKALAFIDGIKTALVTDQDFSDADKTAKFLKDGEDRLALAKQQALAQTASIDDLFRTVDAISAEMRSKRLALEKLVKAEKENRKVAIITTARQAIEKHVDKLNTRIGGVWMPAASAQPFIEAVHGKKSLASMQDAVDAALANEKIRMNEVADLIEANRKSLLEGTENDTSHLFPDFGQVCTKQREDFAALHAMRIQQEAVRKNAEHDAIRQQEAAKAAAVVVEAVKQVQGGNAEEATHAQPQATAAPQAPAASTPPMQAAYAVCEQHTDDATTITEFLALLAISAVEKKALRTTLEKFVKYQHARMNMKVAA